MYASQGRISSSPHSKDTQPAIPVETYDNRAVLEELARRNNNGQQQRISNQECDKCDNTLLKEEAHCDSATVQKCHESVTENCACRKNHGLLGSFGADDVLILLIILLTITDGDGSNDILIPILLGLLLLT